MELSRDDEWFAPTSLSLAITFSICGSYDVVIVGTENVKDEDEWKGKKEKKQKLTAANKSSLPEGVCMCVPVLKHLIHSRSPKTQQLQLL